jgi:hypothetical protein
MSLHRFLKEHAMAKAKGIQSDCIIAGRAHPPEVEFLNSEQVRQAIYADLVGLGMPLPKSAPRSWGGHYIYVPGYTAQGPVCVTWVRNQQMTWAWLDEYYDEAYAIFDAKDSFKETVIDEAKLNAFVARIPADC